MNGMTPFQNPRGGRRVARWAPVLALLIAVAPAHATMPTPAGEVPEALAEGFRAGLFSLPQHALPTGTSAVRGVWHVPVILVGFAGSPLTIGAAEFETALFDSTGSTPSGSVRDYYRWVSGDRLRLSGKVVATVNLPNTRAYYAQGYWGLTRSSTPENLYGMVRDALLTCDGSVDWGPFDVDHDGFVDVLWVIHQGVGGETTADRTNLWSITSRMGAGWTFGGTFTSTQRIPGTSNQFYKVDVFSTLPELSAIIPGRRAEIGTFCHEFGHALGLPDLYDTSGIPAGFANAGPGHWSLMSTGGYGGQGLTPERPSHIGGWCQRFLGWAQTVRPTEDTLITLRPIARGDPLIEVWFQGEESPEHFLIENRNRESFDSTLYTSGLIVYHVDEGVISQRLAGNHVNVGMTPGLLILEGDGDDDLVRGTNRGDANDPLPGAMNRTAVSDETLPNLKSFRGAYSNLALGDIERIGQDVRFRLQVRAPGWGSQRPVGAPFGTTYDSGRPGRWARTDSERRVHAVRSAWIAGRTQIVLDSRLGGVWMPEEVVSASPVGAFDPAIATLPGGDLAVVWTDGRGGRSQIYYRARIRGAWQPEALVSNLSGDSHHASIGTDDHGTIQVAWITDNAGSRRIYFKRFAYLAPFGMVSAVTFPGENPDPPALEVRPNGRSYLLWSDRAAFPPRLYLARFHPDSGVSARVPLTSTPAEAQLGVSMAADGAGDLHIVWQVAGSGVNELHYQRRRLSLPPAPRDTTLARSGYLLLNPSLACDDSGAVHVMYENWGSQIPVPHYRLWTPARGWDLGGTTLVAGGEGGIFPAVLPHSPGDVTALYIRQDGPELQVTERRRRLGASATLSSPPGAPAAPAGWRLAPNPLRAGGALSLGAAGEGTAFEIYDLSGRRVAEVDAVARGSWREARLPAGATAGWAGGVYFARLRGGGAAARFVVLR